MAALLMQGVGRERVKLYYEKRRDKKDESLERGIRWKEREEQRKRKAVRVLLSRIKRGDKGELKAPKALSSKPMEKRRHAHKEELTIHTHRSTQRIKVSPWRYPRRTKPACLPARRIIMPTSTPIRKQSSVTQAQAGQRGRARHQDPTRQVRDLVRLSLIRSRRLCAD